MSNPKINPNLVEADPAKPYKAYVSGGITLVLTFFYMWLQDRGGKRGFTREELLADVGASLLASGLVGGGTFLKKNPKRVKPHHV